MTAEVAEAIIEEFEDLLDSDEEKSSSKGQRLAVAYDNEDEDGKVLMDYIFITLCGHSFKTIREKSRTEGGT